MNHVFSADIDFVKKHAGPITQSIVATIEATEQYHNFLKVQHERDDVYCVIDTRVNMLMPGMYPSIPGWHCDDVPRHVAYSQPDLNGIDTQHYGHFLVLVTDNPNVVSATEFITEPVTVPINPDAVWQSMNDHLKHHTYKTGKVQTGDIVYFSQTAIHRATACVHPGWRLFLRLSFTYRKPVNEIRNHVQVYIRRQIWDGKTLLT